MDNKFKQDIDALLTELIDSNFFTAGELCVIGCSTSEVTGNQIGTNSSDEVAEYLFNAFQSVSKQTGVYFCFQGCEHINRAITIEQEALHTQRDYTKVNVKPVKKAGGSMSAFAYAHMQSPVVIEHVVADCGIDIGQTLIGMHIKHVQVPKRTIKRTIGEAIVTIATHRNKLIGGERANYQ